MSPSAKPWPTTAMSTRIPTSVSTLKASPMPTPSVKVWSARARAPAVPTWWWERASSGSSRWWSTRTRSKQEEGEEPGGDHRRRVVGVADVVDRLGDELEQRDRDDDAAREREDGRQGGGKAQGEGARRRGSRRWRAAAAGIATSGMVCLAAGAGALQGHLVRGHAEAALAPDRADRALELLVVEGDEPAAVAAEEVVVVLAAGTEPLIARGAAAEVEPLRSAPAPRVAPAPGRRWPGRPGGGGGRSPRRSARRTGRRAGRRPARVPRRRARPHAAGPAAHRRPTSVVARERTPPRLAPNETQSHLAGSVTGPGRFGQKKGPRGTGAFRSSCVARGNYSSGASRAFQSASLTNFVRFVPSFWARRA